MPNHERRCSDCESNYSRRDFLKTAGVAAALAGTSLPVWAQAKDTRAASSGAESMVKVLYESLSDMQKKDICFSWDHQDPKRGLLRTHVANNWHITEHDIGLAQTIQTFDRDQTRVARSATYQRDTDHHPHRRNGGVLPTPRKVSHSPLSL